MTHPSGTLAEATTKGAQMTDDATVMSTAAKFVVLEAMLDGTIGFQTKKLAFHEIDLGRLPRLMLLKGGVVQITKEGLECDCGKGLLCPQNTVEPSEYACFRCELDAYEDRVGSTPYWKGDLDAMKMAPCLCGA